MQKYIDAFLTLFTSILNIFQVESDGATILSRLKEEIDAFFKDLDL